MCHMQPTELGQLPAGSRYHFMMVAVPVHSVLNMALPCELCFGESCGYSAPGAYSVVMHGLQ
jgi:hypothetical protein